MGDEETYQVYSGGVAMKSYLEWTMLVYQESFDGGYNGRTISSACGYRHASRYAAPNGGLEGNPDESKSGGAGQPPNPSPPDEVSPCPEESGYSENVYPSVELTAHAKGQIKVR